MPHVCPWWGGYFLDNRFRRWLHDPHAILAPFLRPGMTVLDVGCGMGFFSIAMAQLMGEQGRVWAVDRQPQMLAVLQQRAQRAGVGNRIQPQLCQPDRLGIEVHVDFALAFAMVHEVPDPRRLLAEIQACLRPGARLLVAEPKFHVPRRAFAQTVALAEAGGLDAVGQPAVRWCQTVLLRRSPA